jgi:hypothetical protein
VTPLVIVLILVAVAVVAVVLVAAAGRRRHHPDDIASFRRQIDALSPRARRETTERMKPSPQSTMGDDVSDVD